MLNKIFKYPINRYRLWKYERSLVRLANLGLIGFTPDYNGMAITPKGNCVLMYLRRIKNGDFKG